LLPCLSHPDVIVATHAIVRNAGLCRLLDPLFLIDSHQAYRNPSARMVNKKRPLAR